jgi:hypothetical protein
MLKLQREFLNSVEESRSSFMLTERIEAGANPEGVRRSFRDSHLLKVSRGPRATLPESPSLRNISVSGGRYAEPVERLTLARKQVVRLTERVRWIECSTDQATRTLRFVLSKRPLGKQNIGSAELREHQAFPALPRLKLATQQYIQSLLRMTGVIEQRGEFDREIIALRRKIGVAQQLSEAFSRFNASPLPKLITLKKNPRTRGASGERAIEGRKRSGSAMLHIEVCNTQIALR